MVASHDELLERIRLGEDSLTELKQVTFAGKKVRGPGQESLADELAAFANTKGGTLILGVEDGTRYIVGIPDDRLEAVMRLVRQACADSVSPPLNFVAEMLKLPDAAEKEVSIIRVEVPRGLFVHRSTGGYLQRVGDAKREMSPEYLARLFQQRSRTGILGFDEQTISRAALEDLEPELWERFRTPRVQEAPEVFLSKLGMARTDEDGSVRPTVAGVLMASSDPRQWLPNAFIQAVAYRGTTPVPSGPTDPYQLDAADITGPLDRQVADACRFVARNMRVAATKEQGRRDIPQFDMNAVFEALVNAVAHRDYSIQGSKIRLRLFSDRLELYSPGTIPNTMGVDSLPFRQSSRNDAITSLLARCPLQKNMPGLTTERATLMDRRGEGVSIILDNSEQLSGKRPEYRLIEDAELLLTIYAANPGD